MPVEAVWCAARRPTAARLPSHPSQVDDVFQLIPKAAVPSFESVEVTVIPAPRGRMGRAIAPEDTHGSVATINLFCARASCAKVAKFEVRRWGGLRREEERGRGEDGSCPLMQGEKQKMIQDVRKNVSRVARAAASLLAFHSFSRDPSPRKSHRFPTPWVPAALDRPRLLVFSTQVFIFFAFFLPFSSPSPPFSSAASKPPWSILGVILVSKLQPAPALNAIWKIPNFELVLKQRGAQAPSTRRPLPRPLLWTSSSRVEVSVALTCCTGLPRPTNALRLNREPDSNHAHVAFQALKPDFNDWLSSVGLLFTYDLAEDFPLKNLFKQVLSDGRANGITLPRLHPTHSPLYTISLSSTPTPINVLARSRLQFRLSLRLQTPPSALLLRPASFVSTHASRQPPNPRRPPPSPACFCAPSAYLLRETLSIGSVNQHIILPERANDLLGSGSTPSHVLVKVSIYLSHSLSPPTVFPLPASSLCYSRCSAHCGLILRATTHGLHSLYHRQRLYSISPNPTHRLRLPRSRALRFIADGHRPAHEQIELHLSNDDYARDGVPGHTYCCGFLPTLMTQARALPSPGPCFSSAVPWPSDEVPEFCFGHRRHPAGGTEKGGVLSPEQEASVFRSSSASAGHSVCTCLTLLQPSLTLLPSAGARQRLRLGLWWHGLPEVERTDSPSHATAPPSKTTDAGLTLPSAASQPVKYSGNATNQHPALDPVLASSSSAATTSMPLPTLPPSRPRRQLKSAAAASKPPPNTLPERSHSIALPQRPAEPLLNKTLRRVARAVAPPAVQGPPTVSNATNKSPSLPVQYRSVAYNCN
ncbi:hypothetical protein C8R46DRAFT_1249165 [Mycena filopes]|nr:hypothetical protein C8R46DRAFT_1249165 [Mycena filopes]